MTSDHVLCTACTECEHESVRIAERRGKKNREQETHVVSQVIILAIFKRL